MQMDPSFALALRAGDEAAVQATGLAAQDVELLRAADPAGISADPGGRRRTQVLGNATSEFRLSLGLLAGEESARDVVSRFPASAEFHESVRRDRSLPLAFAAYARRRVESLPGVERLAAGAVLALETAMARARRRSPATDPSELRADEVRLSPRASLLKLPAGTLALAAVLRDELDLETGAERPAPSTDELESVLILSRREGRRRSSQELHVERLEPPSDRLLERARRPLGASDRSAFAREVGASTQELEGFVDGLVADGVLLRGSARDPA